MQHSFSSVNIHKILVFMCLFALRLELFCCLMDANFKLKCFTQIVCKYMEFLGIIYMHFTFEEKPFQCSTAVASQNAYASVSQFGLFCYHFHRFSLHRSHSRFACRSLFTVRINLRNEKTKLNKCKDRMKIFQSEEGEKTVSKRIHITGMPFP